MRRKRPLNRNTDAVRDTRLVVIASEDRYAVRQYFEFFRSTRVQFKCLETVDGKSAPEHLLGRLNDYIQEFDIGDGDEFWLVADTDHWIEPDHIKNFVNAISECRKKGIRVTISRPCFELWLLLHFADFPTEAGLTCAELGHKIRAAVGHYDKKRIYNLPITDETVARAINQAKSNTSSSGEVPAAMETRVFQIIDELFHKGFLVVEVGIR